MFRVTRDTPLVVGVKRGEKAIFTVLQGSVFHNSSLCEPGKTVPLESGASIFHVPKDEGEVRLDGHFYVATEGSEFSIDAAACMHELDELYAFTHAIWSSGQSSVPIIAVVGGARSGKTFSSRNIASQFALIGKETLLVTLDPRSDTVGVPLGVSFAEIGPANVTRGGIVNAVPHAYPFPYTNVTEHIDMHRIVSHQLFQDIGHVMHSPKRTSSAVVVDMFSPDTLEGAEHIGELLSHLHVTHLLLLNVHMDTRHKIEEVFRKNNTFAHVHATMNKTAASIPEEFERTIKHQVEVYLETFSTRAARGPEVSGQLQPSVVTGSYTQWPFYTVALGPASSSGYGVEYSLVPKLTDAKGLVGHFVTNKHPERYAIPPSIGVFWIDEVDPGSRHFTVLGNGVDIASLDKGIIGDVQMTGSSDVVE